MWTRKRGIRGWLLAIIVVSKVWGYVYYDDFASSNGFWQYKFLYSLQAGIHNEAHNMTIAPSGGLLQFSGDGLTTEYYAELFGFFARYTNVRFSATEERPFGFEFTRTLLSLDSDEGIYEESGRKKAAFNVGIVQYDPLVSGISNKYANYLFFSEVYHPKLAGEANTQPRSLWSLNESGSPSNVIDFSAVVRPDGVATSDLRGIMNWCYDDRWGTNTVEPGGTLNNYSNNNNHIKIRVTMDGKYASLYINPNPNGVSQQNWDGTTTTYLNTFYLVAKVPVIFSNELMVVFGLANNRGDAERLLLNVDNFTIRTISASNIAEISPVMTKAGSTNVLTIAIKPWFSTTTEAGVQELFIRLPEAFSHTNWAAFTNTVAVFWMHTNKTVYKTFAKTFGDMNPSAGSAALSLKENGRLLKIRFAAGATAEVFHPDFFGGDINVTHQYMIVVVVSNFFTSSAGDVVGKTFEVYVNNEKYPDTTWGRVATTGPAKAMAGDVADWGGAFFDSNTLCFRTANDPVGIASVRPNFVYEGESKTWFVDIAAKDTNEMVDNNADIAHVDIFLPPGFLVDSSSIKSAVCSSIFYDSAQRKISLLYSNDNRVLAAGSGNDTVSFLNLTTTNLDIPAPGTNEMSNRIMVVSYSALPGTKPVTNGISISYPTQHFLVRKKPPKAEAYQTPREVKNILSSQEYSFVVKNRAENPGNSIRRLLIRVDKVITNIASVVSGRPATVTVTKNITNGNITNTEGYLWILVDYYSQNTNIPKDYTEIVRFTGYDNVKSLTNVIIRATNIAYVDNGNGDGWTEVKEDVSSGWSYLFYTPPAELKASIVTPLNEDGVADASYNHHHYVDENSPFYLQLSLRNTGEKDNTIFRVRITFPYGITNVMYPSSMIVSSNQISLYKTNSGSNWVMEVAYTNTVALWSGSNDMISCYLMDDIASPTNVIIRLEARNTTNYVLAENDGADNTELRFLYPRPKASGGVVIPGGFIDAATNQATITYIVSNHGSVENLIKRVFFLVPTNMITNVTSVSSLLGGVFSGFEFHAPGYYRVVLDYGNQFYGGRSDTITMTLWDRVETEAEFPLRASVSNQRMWSNTIAVLPEGTQMVSIIPPPTFYEYAVLPTVLYRNYSGKTNTNIICLRVKNNGWGSNRLERLRIVLPPVVSNQIFMVSNAFLGVTSPGAALRFITLGGTNVVEVNYKLSNTNIPPGGMDDFYLYVALTTNVVATNWIVVHAANNSTNIDGSPKWTNYYAVSSLLSRTNVITLVDPVRFFVLPGEVSSPASSAIYSNRIENGFENGGRLISAVEIEYPSAFFSSLQVLSTTGNSSVNGSCVRIDYPYGLMPNNGEWVVIRGYDTWTAGDTNFSVTVRVWYTNNASFTNMAVVREGYTNKVSFVHPFAEMWAWSTPNTVGQDFITNLYVFGFTNVGGEGNDIRWVKIVLPSFITNVTGLASLRGALVTNTNGALWIYYPSLLPVEGYDEVRFWGWDTIDPGQETNIIWEVYADNTLGYTKPVLAGTYPSRSLALSIIQPGYRAAAYLEVTNAISLSQTNAIWTTETNNGLRFYLYNNSDTGNLIRMVKIPVPSAGGLLLTNALTFTNMRAGVNRAFSNGAMWLDYRNAPLYPTESDEIWVQLHDSVFYSNTNVTWQVEAAYNTTDDKFKPVSLQPGRSLSVYYVAPSPVVEVSLLPGIIYFDRKYFALSFVLSNAGKSTSAVDEVTILLPPEFTNGFSHTRVSNTMATSRSYANGVLTLGYGTPLAAGQKDTLVLWLSNTMIMPGIKGFKVNVRSFVTNAVARGESNLVVSSMPVYAVYVNDRENDNDLDTTTHSNRVVVQVVNDVTSDKPIERLRISLPGFFTNRVQTLSRKVNVGFISGDPTNIVVDYKTGGNLLAAGEYDILQNDVLDNFEVGYTTNSVLVWVEDPWGYLPLPVISGRTNEIRMVMPLPKGRHWLGSATIYIDTFVSNLTIFVSNTAQTANVISNVEILLPEGFVDIHDVISGLGNASYEAGNHLIRVRYASGLSSNRWDAVTFTFSNTYRAPTNLRIMVRATHLPNHTAILPSLLGEDYSTFPVSYPPVAVEGYFVGDNALYIVENEGILTYRLMNRTFKSEVRRVLLTFETNTLLLFSNIVITNTRATVTRLQTNSNQFLLEYLPGAGIGSQENEDLKIHFSYTLSNTGSVPVRSIVDLVSTGVGGTNVSDYQTFSLDERKTRIVITNSTWGIVCGSVFPGTKLVYVKMYGTDGVSIGLDDTGNPLSQTIQLGSGSYRLTHVPQGTYVLEFSAPYYRTIRTHVDVPANQTVRLPVIAMRNAPLMGGEDEAQVVECYEDTNTMVVFPGGSVGKEFSVDITRVPLTAEQKRNLTENKTVKAPSTTT
ncbi:MAG: carboxypeptidase regulatory-like domain-containing protein, partial [Brevinematales bacterium]|nr:carboxypeptidase regulatory-like domain-containing protein [Brevinematales bacterium]